MMRECVAALCFFKMSCLNQNSSLCVCEDILVSKDYLRVLRLRLG